MRLPARLTQVARSRWVAAADQVLSGLSNFLTVVVVARSLSADDFGHFSLTLALVLFALTLARGLWGTRVSMTPDPAGALQVASALLGSTVLVAVPLVVVISVISLVLSGLGALQLVVLTALAAPLVIAQDLGRYAAVATGRPMVALLSDAAWLLAVVVCFVVRPTEELAVSVWLLGAALGLLVGVVMLGLRPSVGSGWRALRTRHPTGEGTAASSLSVSLASYGVLALGSLAVGASAAGSLRGASSLMAPINALFAFTSLALLPALYRRDRHQHGPYVMRLAGLLAGAVVVWGGLLLVLPPQWGSEVMGDSWPGIRSVLPFTVTEYAFLAFSVTWMLALQVRERARELLRLGWLGAALLIGGALGAALLSESVQVFALVQTVAAAVGATVSGFVVWRLLRRDRGAAQPEAVGTRLV